MQQSSILLFNSPGHVPENQSGTGLTCGTPQLFEYILGDPGTVLGKILRREFDKCQINPPGFHNRISAPMAAALAREGLALAATYRSCMSDSEKAEYLRIGPDGIFLDLSLSYPTGEYRSKAAVALGQLLHQTYLNHLET